MLTLTRSVHIRHAASVEGWHDYLRAHGSHGFNFRPEWPRIFQHAFRHTPFYLEARADDELVGILPLAFVKSRLFGRYLVSLPYLNTGGVLADTDDAADRLIDEAITLATELDVRHLELRHEREVAHPHLNAQLATKAHLRLPLPATADELWHGFRSKLRSQIKKPLANASLTTHWGRHDLLDPFYDVFCANMRDLGTPPFTRKLFDAVLSEFPEQSEICLLRHNGEPVSAALLLHAPGTTQVPSASTLRSANRLAPNMLLYWRLLERTIERGQHTFDFGRSTIDSGTWDFKKQWGADDYPAIWQYHVRRGNPTDLRPDNAKYARAVRLWQKLPIPLTRWIGPAIVRGIP